MTTNTIAVTGAIDQVVGAVGAGNIVPDVVTETTGGALAILVTSHEPLFDPQRRIPVHYHARPDTYCLMAWAQTAGMALRWFRDQFYHLETQVSIDSGLDAYDLMTRAAEQVPPGADGLVVLPHLEGAACPEFNPDARAVFFGATLMHTKAHFVRGILESVAFMLKKNLDIIEQMGIAVCEIRSMGGGARSDLWLRIKADVLQKPVRAVEVEETACLGAALMAATATGYYDDLDEAVAETVRLREAVEPLPDHAQVYAERYRQYRELYERLAPLF
jgi:xylulokinase